jgi:hypothetical protein
MRGRSGMAGMMVRRVTFGGFSEQTGRAEDRQAEIAYGHKQRKQTG